MQSEIGSDILVQHGEFVRSLARALVREPHLADDVAQEAWMRWFTRPPADRSRPRAWLARVTSGLAHNKKRSERRRADVESGASPAEPTHATPLDSCLEAERIERVVAAVRALETPYREVILARYFHGLSVGELARESGTGEDTLRSRERRALEQLRAKLDHEFGGREAWAVGLGALAGRAVSGVGFGAAAGWLVAGGLLATSGAVALWASAGAASEPSAVNSAALIATAPASSIEPEPGAREPLSAAPTTLAATLLGGASGSSSAPITSTQAEVRATFLLHDGRPAAGAEWSFSGSRSDGEEHPPEEWTNRSGTLDATGAFVQSFDPLDGSYSLDVKAPGHAWVHWWWTQKISAGQTIDLGTVTLPRGATITGRLVDASGAPILGQKWDIGSATVGLRGAGSRDDSYAGARLDPDTGEFRLEDVHPGRNKLRANSRIGDSFDGPTVELTGGETLAVELVYRGPSVTDRLTVSTSCAPFASVLATPAAEHVRLRLPDGSTRTAQRDEGTSSRYSFSGLAPGEYGVEIDDPRFMPFFLDALTPGTDVRAPLEPSAEVRLSVVNAAGEPVAPERIEVEFQNVNFFPNTVVVHEGQGGFGGTLRLFPGECLLHVEAGGARASLAVVALGAGEMRPMTLRLGAQPSLTGRVVRTNGAPLAGETVMLLTPASVDDSDASSIEYPGTLILPAAKVRHVLATTTSDGNGGFAFALPSAGRYLVLVQVGSAPPVLTPVLTVAEGERREGVELVVGLGATLRGRLLGPAGVSFAGLRLWGGAPVGTFDERAKAKARAVEADGRFELADLPSGSVALRLLLPETDENSPGPSWTNAWSSLGTLELTEGATLEQNIPLPDFPGALSVTALVNGAPMTGVQLSATRQHDGAWQEVRITADPDGRFQPLPLFAGNWSLRLASPERDTWAARLPAEVHVPAAGSAHAHFAVELATGTLRFLDSAGQPLANQRVRLRLDHPHEQRSWSVKTDADGRATLTLATGIHQASLDGSHYVAITWTTAGPVAPEVRL